MRGKALSGSTLAFGEIGLKAQDCGWVTGQQIEAARKALSHESKRIGKIWIRIFPDKSYTKRPAGARMGGGKGDIEGYVAVVKPGRILFEMTGIDRTVARRALWLAGQKLSLSCKIVEK